MARNAGQEKGRRIVVVTAHPDDEMGFGSVLTHYARSGATVRLLCLTLGQKGFRSHTGIDDGDELARVRERELRDSSRILGLEPPIVLEFVDQELLGPAQERVRRRVKEELTGLRPDVVVTFGPDGVTGHVDHRAVSCFVTEILQATPAPGPSLFYFALSLEHVAAVERRTGRTLLGVAEPYLNTRIRVPDEDVQRAVQAIGVYRSQFAPDAMERLQAGFRTTSREVWFRRVLPGPRAGEPKAESLFEGPPSDRGGHA